MPTFSSVYERDFWKRLTEAQREFFREIDRLPGRHQKRYMWMRDGL